MKIHKTFSISEGCASWLKANAANQSAFIDSLIAERMNSLKQAAEPTEFELNKAKSEAAYAAVQKEKADAAQAAALAEWVALTPEEREAERMKRRD